MPPPTASLRPEPVRSAGKKDKDTAAASSSNNNNNKLNRADQAAYGAEQDQLNKEIAAVREEMNEIKSRLDLLHNPRRNGNSNGTEGDSAPTDRRSQIKAEMDDLQGKQGSSKADRGKTLDAIKRHQDSISTKSKEITAIRQKLPYRNSSEIQSRISQLDSQIESGKLKLIDEKKALNEISTLRRSTKQVATLEGLEASIDEDKQKIDELRKVLDDPEVKQTQARWDELKREMDELREQQKKAYDERGGLFDKRNALSAKLDELYDRKRTSNAKHRADNEAYRAKVEEDRKAKNEKYRAERAAEDSARREEQIQRMREDAKIPAFEREIEDCGVLIGWFERQYGSGSATGETQQQGGLTGMIKGAIDGIKSLDIRKVEESEPVGTVLQKDRDDTEGWGAFAGTGGKKKGKGGKKTNNASAPAAEASTPAAATNNNNISLPFSTLNTLLGFGISPPANKDDVPRVVQDLSTKKAWFEANQKRKTEEEVERVEKQIQKMSKKSGGNGGGHVEAETDEPESVSKEVGGEREPNHTVAIAGDATKDISVEQGEQLPETLEERSDSVHKMDEELEHVKVEEGSA